MKLGDRLKEIRTNRGMSQEEVAENIGISRYLISKYENNICIPRGKVLLDLAKVYHVNTDYLLNYDNGNNLIDFYTDILDNSTKSKINPFLLDGNNQYFAIFSNFENQLGINNGDMLVFARNCCDFRNKTVLASNLSRKLFLGFLWAKNGVKMLSIKNDQPPIDISDDKEYEILGYLVKSIRDYGGEND